MAIRRIVTWSTVLLLLVGCGSTVETVPSATEASSDSLEPVLAPDIATGSSEPSHDPSTAPPLYEPHPSEITTVAAVQLAEDPDAPVADDLERLAVAWVRYAMREADTFPHSESISMAVGGETTVAVDDVAAALSDRDIWKRCPPGRDIYGAASCPVDMLGPVRSAVINDTVLIYSSAFEEVTCAPARANSLPAGRVVVLRPLPMWRTCATDFSLALVADQQGRLRHVDITLSEP